MSDMGRAFGRENARNQGRFSPLQAAPAGPIWASMIPKSGNRFSEKIMLKQKDKAR
jgi:hypothetical protein